MAAGFDTSEFIYIGFLPQKKGRQTALKTMISRDIPTFFYESVHRMGKLVGELHELNFDGKIAIAREVSKLFEEYQTFDFLELWDLYQTGKLVLKGEFVV